MEEFKNAFKTPSSGSRRVSGNGAAAPRPGAAGLGLLGQIVVTVSSNRLKAISVFFRSILDLGFIFAESQKMNARIPFLWDQS